MCVCAERDDDDDDDDDDDRGGGGDGAAGSMTRSVARKPRDCSVNSTVNLELSLYASPRRSQVRDTGPRRHDTTTNNGTMQYA